MASPVDADTSSGQSAAGIPVARVGAPEDIANAVSFFVGEDAGFVSGQVQAAWAGLAVGRVDQSL
ncbi:hypothetical protein GUY60_03775 [Streptomyces sp. YC537]|uniref:Oxidoreductase n=1 Tax=Streptomyces boluensis TaxID=1775135 RepID=A0A964XKC4_9ACTN|nr:hypothetical protein [Streptomyces boluensis]